MKPVSQQNEFRSRVDLWLKTGILALLLVGCLLVLWPFMSALIWASVLSFSLWPLNCRLVRLLKGRRTLAAVVLSLAMVVALLLPFGIVTVRLTDNVTELKTAAQNWLENPPGPPEWLAKVPLVGHVATEKWSTLIVDKPKLREETNRLLQSVAAWLLAASLKLGRGLLQMALSLLITFFLLRNGTAMGEHLLIVIERVAGEHGKQLLKLAGDTTRGVVYGILGTALVQACLAGFGFLLAGVPGGALLALLVFFLSVVPGGPPIVMFPAAFWLFHQGDTGWGIFMLIWGVGVSTIDNFVKPWLISQGSDMPLILILFGVMGGAFAFGFIGVFIGPTLLAVGYRLVSEWEHTPLATEDEKPEHLDRLSHHLSE